MVSLFDVNANRLISQIKEDLKKIDSIKPPAWMDFVKTGVTRSKPPSQSDFWYIRAAAILRQIYKVGQPTGVQRLRTKYGGKEQKIAKPKHSRRGAGKIIRVILQQLEKADLLKKSTGPNKGRIISAKGKSLVDKAAARVKKENA